MPVSEEARVLEQHGGPFVASDGEGRFIYVSKESGQVLGYAPEELVGRPLVTIMPERMRERHLQAFARYRATGNSRLLGRPIRVPALHAAGHEVEIDLTIRYFRSPEGEPVLVARIEAAGHAVPEDMIRLESAFRSRAYMLI